MISLSDHEVRLNKIHLKKCHPSIRVFLRDNPHFEGPVSPKLMEIDKTYPNPKSWYDYSKVLTLTNSWGEEILMTKIAKHFLGMEVAAIFPKFYISEWPKVILKKGLLNIKIKDV